MCMCVLVVMGDIKSRILKIENIYLNYLVVSNVRYIDRIWIYDIKVDF